MPKQSGSSKKKRKKSKSAEVSPHSDATSTNLPCASGASATSGGDGGMPESKEDSTGVCVKDINITGSEVSVEKNNVTDDEKSETLQGAKKKKKKKKKTKSSHENGGDLAPDDSLEKEVTVGEKDKNSEVKDSNLAPGDSLEKEVTVGGKDKNSEVKDNNFAPDDRIGKEVTVGEKVKNSDVKDSSVSESYNCDEVVSSGIDTFYKIASEDKVSDEGEEIAAHEQPDVAEERNFARLIRLMMGVGADCLRKYFLSIHPTWSNQPSDASALKKGVLKLQTHQQAKFYTGNIDEWDVSLLISVLRFSALSSVEVSRYPDIDDALRNIQEIRNNVIAHANDKKISAADFMKTWEKLKLNLVAIGGSENEINATLTDYTERALEQYRQLFLEEISFRKLFELGREKTKDVTGTSEENNFPEIHPTPQWDAWLKFHDQMNAFNTSQTQFVLLADVMAQADLENYKVLAAIPWKMVIDFNPSSEDDGLYKVFNCQTCLPQVLSPFTPGEISKVGYVGLPKQIDSKRTQWLFANGRKEDAEDSKPRSFPQWEQKSVKNIAMFFACCDSVDMFDNHKPIRCLLLPVSQAVLPFVEVTIKRFIENISPYDLSFTCIDNSCERSSHLKEVQTFQLSSAEIKNGMVSLFNITEDHQKYEMPCFQSGIPVPFSQKDYVYISEYLELFYIGCERKFLHSNDEEEEQQAIEEEHRKCFLSGNLISFLNLYFNHDAKRRIEKDIEIHIQRMLDQRVLKHSGIVQIAHPPGTGGSTIARRVLWNLHESFPCGSVRLSSQTKFDEDSNFINELASRISILEDTCGVPPVILIDGRRQWRIHALSNRIVRTLNSLGKRAVILECYRGSKPSANAEVHKVFNVDAGLENNPADLREFKEKFQEANRSACRVFHFPLLSMMVEFREKLEEIVANTLNELDDLEKDIAAFVAFMQLYAEQSTPAILLYEAFQSRYPISKGVHVTYQSIKGCFSGSLLNLMVHQEKRKAEDNCLTQYTLQHHVIATLVFNKYLESKKENLYDYVYEFLECPIPNMKRFADLYCDLFLFNKGGDRKLRFSVLIEQLRNCNPKQAATILRKAAEKIPDPRAYGHAARFHAKMTRPKFKEAEELIAAGIKLSESHGRVKSIHDSKGVVLCLELKHKIRCKRVQNIDELKELAEKALDAFHAARDFPLTFPFPLIGEVEVWIACVEWITRDQGGDAEEAVKFIINKAPPFFRTCIGDSFYLLELVDKMVLSVVTINADPDEIRDRAQHLRISLMTALRPGICDSGRRRNISDSLLSIDLGVKLPKMSWKESKRIRTGMLLTLYRREQQSFKTDEMIELMKLLEDMVLIEKDYSFAPHFLQLCLEGNGPRMYNLERGWKVCRDWLEIPDCLDPKKYYYSMVLAFVQILNGLGPSGYFAEYKNLVQKLKDASRGHCRRNQSLHFLKKHGDGISQLISYQSLLSDESSYKAEEPDVVKSFWTVDSRRKLKECTGRLRVKVEGTKKVTKIELLEGDIELYVGKYAEIGVPGKDFDKDAKVYFVVSFNLIGPVANGITFRPTVEQKKNGVSLTR